MDALVKQYTPLVSRIAKSVLRRLPLNIELDDLIQAGLIGLWKALSRLDVNRQQAGGGVEAFLSPAIRGAMIDYLRDVDLMPRDLRRRVKVYESSKAAAVAEGDHTKEGIARRMGGTLRDVLDLEIITYLSSTVHLDESFFGHDGEEHPSTEWLQSESPGPEDQYAVTQRKEAARRQFLALDERTQRILQLRFDSNMTLPDIGAIFGITNSRVSQIIHRALMQLLQATRAY